jgi:cytochrome oxidase assembly protein ShyY1
MAADTAAPTPRPASKYRFLLSPKWIGFHLLVLGAVVAMINLAFWQLDRLDQRQRFNDQVRANSNQPIGPLDEVLASVDNTSSLEWRRVSVTGTFLPDHQFLVVNRSQNGDTGRNVVEALQLDDGSLVLVNRGFVPVASPVPATPTDNVEIVGRLRASEVRKTGQPSDTPSGTVAEIRRVEIAVLSPQFDAPVLPMYVEQLTATPRDLPTLQPIVAPTLDEGPHLSYTIQWFVFSVCVLVGWVFAVRRSMAMRAGKAARKRKSAYVPFADDESVS